MENLHSLSLNLKLKLRYLHRSVILSTLILTSALSYAQSVQWATKVIEYSSQLSPGQYSAQQALGMPNVLPAGGENPNAWVPDKPNRREFLKLGFDRPANVRQIAIAESYNPSALYRILLYDEAGKEYEVSTLSPKAIPLKGRMLNIFIETTSYKAVAIKLEFDGAAVPDYYGIDAVAITDANYPVIAQVPESAFLASGIIIEPLDKNVNSDVSEYNPILSPDGKTLYFSRRNHPGNIGGVKDKEDIWYSELDENGKWTLAKNMGPMFNNEFPNFINSINAVTPDGKSAIMVLGNKYIDGGKKMQAGISISSNVSGKWTAPKPVNITNDYNYHEKANYFLTNNRQTLLMSVQRDDTYGDRDLYVSFMNSDSTWTEPLNLGSTINTMAEESAPFLAIDDKTLYFSSKGFSGYGGADIYISKRLDDTWTNWTAPENMGKTINSPQDDLFFNIPANSEYAYYSRGISDTNSDIFRVRLPVIKSPEPWVTVTGKLIDSGKGEPIGAKIIYERLPDGKDMGLSESDPKTGEFELKLPGGANYSIRAEAKDYMSESQNLDLRNVTADKVITHFDFRLRPIQVVPIQKDAVVRLNSIFFDFDKAVLKPESFPELDRVVQMMSERPTIVIEVAGHTDNIGTVAYNQNLSERRANAVKKYLTSKGIDVVRITAVGYGETKPIVSNDDEKDGREINRRVEFMITNM
jgi:OmpA-OmpF porin, OOP family